MTHRIHRRARVPAPQAPRQAQSAPPRRRPSPSTGAASEPSRPSACCGAPGSARARARPRSLRGRASTERSTRSRGRARKERLGGPPPHDQDGHPLAPADAWGHDHLWWLDRMLRTNRPLTERMTLVWHDWFATSNEGVGLAAPDDPPERDAAEERARVLPRSGGAGHARPGDAAVALGGAEQGGLAERELRARADGAVHARRGPRLHRGRRARAGARADRLPQRLGRRRRAEQLPLRPRVPRRAA